MTSQDELRDRIERQLCMFFDEGYDGHLFDAAQAIIDDLGLIVVDVPGGISGYSPFTGKPEVQPDRWYVDGERILERRSARIDGNEETK